MGKRKITCNNTSCLHNTGDNGCDTCVVITPSGKCGSFEKGFAYYFHIVWDALKNKNYIDAVELKRNPDLKIGLYYVMRCYGLGFSEMEWGMCRMLLLKDGEQGEALDYKKIIARELNKKEFEKCFEDFQNGIMPNQREEQEAAGQQETKGKEFGWLSPTGEFTESPFGHHEESAGEICEKKGFDEEYWEWRKKRTDGENCLRLKRDFLSAVKGYCLIHNPSGYGGYIVTNMRNLTRKQKEFLYGYFMDMGDRFKAEQFIE